jgi:hypothetical protein
MRPDELDRAYVLLSQTISRLPPEEHALFLSRLVLLLLADHAELASAERAIRAAEPDPG